MPPRRRPIDDTRAGKAARPEVLIAPCEGLRGAGLRERFYDNIGTMNMPITSYTRQDRALNQDEIYQTLEAALGPVPLDGKRLLVIGPDGTRTAPVAALFGALRSLLLERAAGLDYLVALGTHPPMSDAALSALVGLPVRNGEAPGSLIHNHRWDLEDTFVTVGAIDASEVEHLSQGRLSLDVPVRVNRLALEYDYLIVLGPVFPHEVAGFSGGNKYFFPGIGGPEIINATHWLGALITNRKTIGVMHTPMRAMIDRAADMIKTPKLNIAIVVHGRELRGIFAGDMYAAWEAAGRLSAQLDVIYVERPFQKALSVMPELYDDLWTAGKGMYKVEPVVADGGEVTIYAPHIDEVSYTHGKILDQIGYHVRDYFTAQWAKFEHYPWGVLAHSTHVRGDGAYDNGVERPRVRVRLATGIPPERCERIGLEYVDPREIDVHAWAEHEQEGILLVPRAGEMLYRLKA